MGEGEAVGTGAPMRKYRQALDAVGELEGAPVNEGGAECGGGTARDVTSPGPTVSRAPLRGEELFAFFQWSCMDVRVGL